MRLQRLVSPSFPAHQYLIDHTIRSQASILRFIEKTFGVNEGALGTLDAASGNDDLMGLLDVTRTPLPPPTPPVSGFPTPPATLPTCPAGTDIPPEPND